LFRHDFHRDESPVVRQGRAVRTHSMTDTTASTIDRDEPSPHDGTHPEPLGPLTPDDQTPLGDTPEAHDEISPHDLPLSHPGRAEAERQAAQRDGTTRGDV
jgi:hypothetical protein